MCSTVATSKAASVMQLSNTLAASTGFESNGRNGWKIVVHLHKLLVCAVVVVDATCLDMQLHTEESRDNMFEFIRVTYGETEETTCLNLAVLLYITPRRGDGEQTILL